MLCRFIAPIFFILTIPAFAEAPGVPLKDAVPHMTTTGEAGADVVPDEAELSFAIVQERKTAEEATDVTAQAAAAVVAMAKTQGVAASDIRTTFGLSETFDAKKDDKGMVGRVPRGYEAQERITMRLHDTAKVGPIARDLIARGANAFEGVSFSYSKAKQKRRDLDAEAMRDALVQARTYTDAVGLKLGRVLQIGEDPSESGGQADLPMRRASSPGAPRVAVPIEPGLQHLQQRVTVIWELEGQAR